VLDKADDLSAIEF